MKKYTIYFEIFGKKLKTTVLAENKEHAKEIIKNKIVFYRIDEEIENDIFDSFFNGGDVFDNLMNIFNKPKK